MQVKSLSEWKTQLAVKNRNLKEENKRLAKGDDNKKLTWFFVFRLLKKTEDLEHLMKKEVLDINEILKVVNKIQVITILNINS